MENYTVKEVIGALGAVQDICNMETGKGGRAVNQFEIFYENGVMFKSYNSIIAIKFYRSDVAMGNLFPPKFSEKTFIGRFYDYSKTTNKYRCQFLDEFIKETRAKMKSGEYIYLEDL
jgi:hypothetical protein